MYRHSDPTGKRALPEPPPKPIPFGSALDAWDVLVVLAGIALGGTGMAVLQGEWLPGLALVGGFVVGIGGMAVRRLRDPRLVERDKAALAKPPDGRLSQGIVLIALGGFFVFLSAVAVAFVLLVWNASPPEPKGTKGMNLVDMLAITSAPGLLGLLVIEVGARRRRAARADAEREARPTS